MTLLRYSLGEITFIDAYTFVDFESKLSPDDLNFFFL